MRSAASAASSMAFCLCTGQKQGGHARRPHLLKLSQSKSFLYFSQFSQASNNKEVTTTATVVRDFLSELSLNSGFINVSCELHGAP